MNPLRDNLNAVARVLSELKGGTGLRIAHYSVQRRFFCPHEPDRVEFPGATVEFPVSADALAGAPQPYDIVILSCHNSHEDRLFWELRRREKARLFVAWLWDNHHHHLNNLRTSMAADLVLVSHWFDRFAQISQRTVLGPHLPLPSRQWSAEGVAAVFPGGLPVTRMDGLFGGFGLYGFTPRNAFIQDCQAALPDHRLEFMRDLQEYFARPYADRLADWARHKVQLMAPVNRDLSTRLFEALITGQIPLMPDDCPDLDAVVPADIQRLLPIIRYKAGDVESVVSAYRLARDAFDREGEEGIVRRHRFAADHHGLTARLGAFVSFIRGFRHVVLGEDGGQFGAFAMADGR